MKHTTTLLKRLGFIRGGVTFESTLSNVEYYHASVSKSHHTWKIFSIVVFELYNIAKLDSLFFECHKPHLNDLLRPFTTPFLPFVK